MWHLSLLLQLDLEMFVLLKLNDKNEIQIEFCH